MAKLREKISVNKRVRQNFDLERFDLKEHDDIQVKEKYCVETSSSFAALETLDDIFGINNAWDMLEKTSRPHKK
jgi:hypothetical protein